MENDDIYKKALFWLGFPDSAAGYEYLKITIKPDELELLLEFLKPAACQEVAESLKMDEQSLQDKLDNFMKRGLLFHGKNQYCFQFGIHVFFNRFAHNKDENIPAGWWQAWRDFEPEEMERRSSIMMQRVANSTMPGSRVVPDRLALAASPKVDPEQILWYEDYSEILRRADQRIVVDCPCRRQDQNCDRPLWTCFYLNEGCTPDLDPKRESRAKVVSGDEAVAYSEVGEIGGLIHSLGNNDLSIALPEILCNCCECCCSELGPSLRSGRLRQGMAPSRYQAVVDTELCSGCQECISRCFFNAIELRKTFTSKKKKAHVLAYNCMGCGSCVLGCERKAITLECVRPPEFIPSQKPMAAPEPAPGEKQTTPIRRMYWDFYRYRQHDLK
jgi:ferredoxin